MTILGQMKVFAHTRLDAVPMIAGLLHLVYGVTMFLAFHSRAPVWLLVAMGAVYAVSISWNINSVAHSFLHHHYFTAPVLNRLFSMTQTVVLGTPQLLIEEVHLRHHRGNSDRRVDGTTVDWLSIYRHGRDGEPENPWTYVFSGFFRSDPILITKEIMLRNKTCGWWAVVELGLVTTTVAVTLVLDWRFVVFMWLPAYYLGHSLTNLNGYYEHFDANPDMPIAWGVSTYGRIYNTVWFNNGYHAEHHFRPNTHWTRLRSLHRSIADQQLEAGVHIIRPPHALGFLQGCSVRRHV